MSAASGGGFEVANMPIPKSWQSEIPKVPERGAAGAPGDFGEPFQQKRGQFLQAPWQLAGLPMTFCQCATVLILHSTYAFMQCTSHRQAGPSVLHRTDILISYM